MKSLCHDAVGLEELLHEELHVGDRSERILKALWIGWWRRWSVATSVMGLVWVE